MDSLSFDWTEFHRLADIMKDWDCSASKEAVYRAAVGRYYYAAYKCMERYAIEKYQYRPSRGSEDHGALTRCLSDVGTHEEKDASNKLRTLRRDRNKCDYDADVENIDRILERSQKNSEKILKLTSR